MGSVMSVMLRQDLQKISRIRIREARKLLNAGEYAGAYYLAGYAVECALKACIAKQTKRYEFPEIGRVKNSYEHDPTKLAKVAGLPEAIGSQLSGHSARVGAAQDMAAAGIDLISIMQAGGWQSPEIVGRYIENLDVMRGGSFRLAMQQIHISREAT